MRRRRIVIHNEFTVYNYDLPLRGKVMDSAYAERYDVTIVPTPRPCAEGVYHPRQRISYPQGISPVPTGTDIIAKGTLPRAFCLYKSA